MLVDRGKNVDDRPAQRKGSWILDDLRAAVASPGEVLDQGFSVQRGVGLDHAAEIGEPHRRNYAPEYRSRRRHHHGGRVAVTQPVQECQPAHDCAAIGLHLGVRRDFGRRKIQDGGRRERILA